MELITNNQINDNIRNIKENIFNYSQQFGRKSKDITLIGVSKYYPANLAMEAVKAGITDLGENRVLDLISKSDELKSVNLFPNWHLIGTLQRKKAKVIVGNTYMIHSVDSFSLLDEISKASQEKNVTSKILLQFNISMEESKHGFLKQEINYIIEELKKTNYSNVELSGIMTMAPLTNDEYIIEDVFASTFEVYNKFKEEINSNEFNVLSMGMSNDYKFAIKHGATHLRIGTAIFGNKI